MAVYKHQKLWRYDFWKNGIRHRRSGFKTKREALLAEDKARKQVNQINTDFISLCVSRLEEVEARRSPHHFKDTKRLIEKHLLPMWGKKKEITRADIEDYLNQIAKESHNLANRRLKGIKALFGHAVEKGLLETNPTMGIKPYSVSKTRKYIPPKEDIIKVLRLASREQFLYLTVIINTMARVGEINKLKWEDVKEDYLILRTRKARNSDVKERMIPLNEQLRAVLKELPHESEYVFTNPSNGKPYDYRKKFLRGLCLRAKVKRFTFHALRHFGASRLAQEGVALTDIQELLGHDRATTTDIYLRSIGKTAKKAVSKLELEID